MRTITITDDDGNVTHAYEVSIEIPYGGGSSVQMKAPTKGELCYALADLIGTVEERIREVLAS